MHRRFNPMFAAKSGNFAAYIGQLKALSPLKIIEHRGPHRAGEGFERLVGKRCHIRREIGMLGATNSGRFVHRAAYQSGALRIAEDGAKIGAGQGTNC